MDIKTLKQLAALRQQIEDTEAEIAEWTARRMQALQEQSQSAQARCVQTFATHFGQDDDFEVEVFDDGAAARYKTLEISLMPLQENSPDLLKLRVTGVFDIDTYHEISLAPPDVASKTPPPKPGGDSEMARLAQQLRELRIELSQLRKEVNQIEDGHLAYVVRGAKPKTRENDGTERFGSFEAYLRSTFEFNGTA
ncbi:MAG: hypothetical protein GVY18_03405 [Bacteroidetes bacterium]|jgi:hypothetical protein|nr:hypothetical protein [Bacteroidota bacterium]